MESIASGLSQSKEIKEIQSKWGWVVLLGMILIILGLLAFSDLIVATSISIFYVGCLMFVGAIFQILHAIQIRTWSGFLSLLLSGVFYGVAGVLAFQNPMFAATTLTLVLAFTLIASGVSRIWSSLRHKPKSDWFLSSGLITILAGLILILGWPLNGLWMLGLMLAIDLTFQGIATVALGLSLKRTRLDSKHLSQVVI